MLGTHLMEYELARRQRKIHRLAADIDEVNRELDVAVAEIRAIIHQEQEQEIPFVCVGCVKVGNLRLQPSNAGGQVTSMSDRNVHLCF